MDEYQQYEMNKVDGGGGSGVSGSGCLSFIIVTVVVFGFLAFIISLFK